MTLTEIATALREHAAGADPALVSGGDAAALTEVAAQGDALTRRAGGGRRGRPASPASHDGSWSLRAPPDAEAA